MFRCNSSNDTRIEVTPGLFGTFTAVDAVAVAVVSGGGAGAEVWPVWSGTGVLFLHWPIDDHITHLEISAGAPGFRFLYTETECRP